LPKHGSALFGDGFTLGLLYRDAEGYLNEVRILSHSFFSRIGVTGQNRFCDQTMLFKELCTGPVHRAQLCRILEHIAPRHVIYRHYHVDQHRNVAGLGDFGMKNTVPLMDETT